MERGDVSSPLFILYFQIMLAVINLNIMRGIRMLKAIIKYRVLLKVLVTVLFLLILFYWGNNGIKITSITYPSKKVPEDFDGYRVVQISDLHNKSFGKRQNKLLEKIKEVRPDIIVVTGDLIDSNHANLQVAMDFVFGAVKLAPVYYVTGNHEAWFGNYQKLQEKLVDVGVIILNNKKIEIIKGDSAIDLYGVPDPDFNLEGDATYDNRFIIGKQLDDLGVGDSRRMKILLSHRPELMDVYEEKNIDLVFSGHAHGGQFRLPFMGGLVAPNQGFFPKYTNGSYVQGNTTEIVSRGLGNSVIPVRIFNRPEITVCILRHEN